MIKAAAAVAIVASALPVAAQDDVTCDYAPAIVSISDTVLAKRTALPRLQARRFGANALYLKMRYGRLDDDEVEPLLQPLLDDGVPLARDLAFAWSYGMSDGTTERLLGSELAASMPTSSMSAIRAMIREGDAEALIADLAAEAEPSSLVNGAVTAAIDFTDAQKTELARLAMTHGMPLLAAGFVASEEKDKAWDVFVRGLDPQTEEMVRSWWRWLPPVVGNPTLPREAGAAPGEIDIKIAAVTTAAAETPQYDFLNAVLNQTGWIDETAVAAEAVKAAVAAGLIKSSETLDAAWLIAYRALYDAVGDTAMLQNTMRTFDVTNERGQLPDKTLAILDRIVAVDALTAYLRGEVAEPPGLPAIASPEFAQQWPLWLDVAAKIKADPDDQTLISGETFPIAAELLLAVGDADAIAAGIGSSPASLSLLRLADDMSIRLDRLCEGFLAHRAEAVLLSGMPIYKFDGRDNQ